MDRIELLLVVLDERADGAPEWKSGEKWADLVVVLQKRDRRVSEHLDDGGEARGSR